ncbi:asparagine synthase-related protein, partial [Oceanithermus sp.]|uniref:asparagine synthase-related protein n=1 Tax=Oceanithermus sp. TaxID=2268145 RepID=UPI0025E8E94C
MKVVRGVPNHEVLDLDYPLVASALERFIREELHGRGFEKAVVAVSGGVDSAVTLALAARALGPGNVHALSLPHRDSSPESSAHARLVAERFGVELETVDITPMVEGYAGQTPGITPRHHVALAARGDAGGLPGVALDHGGDVHGFELHPEALGYQPGVGAGLGRGVAVGQA